MRKNGINRELRPIEGGVCAPEGYKANAVACGIREDGSLDFGMIFSERRCAVACAYASGKTQGAPVTVSKRNMRNGYARAILVNGGIANVVGEDSEPLAKSVCDLLFSYGVERGETVIASTGVIGNPLSIVPFKLGISSLWKGLSSSHEQSEKVARAMRGEDGEIKQLSYAFDLGDYPCKIGVVFKGGPQISPNMATFLAFLTTDVNIDTPTLQKALNAEVRETLNLINLDGTASPNDTVCIMANGKAGNYKITCQDSEYKKFTYALRSVLTEVCRRTVKKEGRQVLTCRVKGMKSKEVARTTAKALVGSFALKNSLKNGKMDMEGLLFKLFEHANAVDTDKLEIRLYSDVGELALYQEGYVLTPNQERLNGILSASEVELRLHLHEGNYQAVAFGRGL